MNGTRLIIAVIESKHFAPQQKYTIERLEKIENILDDCSDKHDSCKSCQEVKNCLSIYDTFVSRIPGHLIRSKLNLIPIK